MKFGCRQNSISRMADDYSSSVEMMTIFESWVLAKAASCAYVLVVSYAMTLVASGFGKRRRMHPNRHSRVFGGGNERLHVFGDEIRRMARNGRVDYGFIGCTV